MFLIICLLCYMFYIMEEVLEKVFKLKESDYDNYEILVEKLAETCDTFIDNITKIESNCLTCNDPISYYKSTEYKFCSSTCREDYDLSNCNFENLSSQTIYWHVRENKKFRSNFKIFSKIIDHMKLSPDNFFNYVIEHGLEYQSNDEILLDLI